MTAKELYKRERRNLQRRIKAWEKKGYQLLIDLPSIPKKITQASVKRLQKFQLKDLVKKGQVLDITSGEIFTPYGLEEAELFRRVQSREVRKKQKQERKRKQEELQRQIEEEFYGRTGYQQEVVLEDEELIGEELDLYEENLDTINEPYLKKLFSEARQELGDEALSRDLQTNKTAGGDSYAQALQVSIGAIQRYKEEGRDDRANTEINQLITRLNYLLGRGPIDAQLSEQIAMGNYAP